MSNTYFYYFSTLFFFIIFLTVGIVGLIKADRNFIIVFLSIIFILIGSIKIIDKFFNNPSISVLNKHYSDLQHIKIINKAEISTKIIEEEFINKLIDISEKNKLSKILFELKEIKPYYFSFKSRGVIDSYQINILSEKNNYLFKVSKYSDNLFYISFYYVDKVGNKYTIGRFTKKVNKNSILNIKNLSSR